MICVLIGQRTLREYRQAFCSPPFEARPFQSTPFEPARLRNASDHVGGEHGGNV